MITRRQLFAVTPTFVPPLSGREMMRKRYFPDVPLITHEGKRVRGIGDPTGGHDRDTVPEDRPHGADRCDRRGQGDRPDVPPSIREEQAVADDDALDATVNGLHQKSGQYGGIGIGRDSRQDRPARPDRPVTRVDHGQVGRPRFGPPRMRTEGARPVEREQCGLGREPSGEATLLTRRVLRVDVRPVGEAHCQRHV